MTAPAAELQKAIFAELGGDAALLAALGGERIFAAAPANVAFPYIGFGRTGVYDWSTGGEKDTEQLFTLHIWSKAKGEAETVASWNWRAPSWPTRCWRWTTINRSISSSNSPRRAMMKTLPFITACCASGQWRPRAGLNVT